MAFLPRGENEERRRIDATDDALEERAMQLPFFRFENNVYCGALLVTSGREARLRFHDNCRIPCADSIYIKRENTVSFG